MLYGRKVPHLYKRNGYYYILHAESGTEQYHCEVAARSRNIFGPYEYARTNPILTHRHLGSRAEITCVGHCDLTEDQAGKLVHGSSGLQACRMERHFWEEKHFWQRWNGKTTGQ